jgi:hypothetical protein
LNFIIIYSQGDTMKTMLITLISSLVLFSGIAHALDREELKTLTATILNLNGLLCAEVTDIRPLEIKNIFEVTCIEYRDGTGTKTYIMDAAKGTAWEP